MNLSHSIRSGVKWILFGNTGKEIFGFLFGIILARLLVPADFGLIVTIGVFTGFVGMFASGGMGQSLIRAKEVEHADFSAVFSLQLSIGVLVYLGFFLIAPWFAIFFENPLYVDLLRVSALTFIIRPFANIRDCWLNREMDFKSRSVINIVCGFLVGILSVFMAWFGMGVWSLVLSALLVSLLKIYLLARVTPLKLRLNFDVNIMRKHASFGSKIVANDFLYYLRKESVKIILSKLAGPAFLGLFNKADSLHILPFRVFGPPVGQPVFRAMSKIQDDLDQTKYIYYRVITLFYVYLLPFCIGLWWIADSFIVVVYGEQWRPAAEPLRILVLGGLFYAVGIPSGILLTAQNRLTQKIIAHGVTLLVTICTSIIGLKWGMAGVSWAILFSQAFGVVYFYVLVYQTIPTKITDLIRAIVPGLQLNIALFVLLFLVDSLSGEIKETGPALYLMLMVFSGSVFYFFAFLFWPIPALESEVKRWREKIQVGFNYVQRVLSEH